MLLYDPAAWLPSYTMIPSNPVTCISTQVKYLVWAVVRQLCMSAIAFTRNCYSVWHTVQCGENTVHDPWCSSFDFYSHCVITYRISSFVSICVFKCVFIPDWRWAALVQCICRTGRWRPIFLLWWMPRIYCPDSQRSCDPSAAEVRRRRCRQIPHRSPAEQNNSRKLS